MSEILAIALAVGAAILIVGGIVWISIRATDWKEQRHARGIAEGAPGLGNVWLASDGDLSGNDCGGSDGGGGCD